MCCWPDFHVSHFHWLASAKKNALGRPHGFECTTQGTLFFDIQRIIEAKKPKAFLLENVKNLLPEITTKAIPSGV